MCWCTDTNTHWARSSVRWSPSCRNTVRSCGRSPLRSDSDTPRRTGIRRNPWNSLKRNTHQQIQLQVFTRATFLHRLFRSSDSGPERWAANLEMCLEAAFVRLANLFCHRGTNMETNSVCSSGRFKQLPEDTLDWFSVFSLMQQSLKTNTLGPDHMWFRQV